MDDENKKNNTSAQEDGVGTKIMTVLGRGAEGVIDSLAEQNFVGAGLQAMVNTQGYQEKKAEQELLRKKREEWLAGEEARALDREASMQRNKEYLQNAGSRALKQKAEDAQAQTVIDTARSNTDAINAKRRAEIDTADELYFSNKMNAGTKNTISMFSSDPAFSSFSNGEITDLVNTKSVQAAIIQRNLLDEFKNGLNGDTAAQERLSRYLEQNGITFEDSATDDGKDGKALLKTATLPDGTKIPVNSAGLAMAQKRVSDAMGREIAARQRNTIAGSSGNPINSGRLKYVSGMAKYNGNSYADAEEVYNKMTKSATADELDWRVVNQAINDYRSGEVSGISSLQKLMTPPVDGQGNVVGPTFLRKLGYTVDMNSLASGRPEAVVLQKKNADGSVKTISFPEFVKMAEEKDTLGKRLDDRVSLMRDSALRRDKELFARTLAETRAAIAQTKAASKSGKGGEEGADENAQKDEALRRSYHQDFEAAYGDNYDNLSSKEQQKLIGSRTLFEKRLSKVMDARGVNDAKNLPKEDLVKLDNYWRGLMDEKKFGYETFYSPVNNLLIQKNNSELSQKNNEMSKSLKAAESHSVPTKTVGGDADMFREYQRLKGRLGGSQGAEKQEILKRMKEIERLRDEYNSRQEDANVHHKMTVQRGKIESNQDRIKRGEEILKSRGRK